MLLYTLTWFEDGEILEHFIKNQKITYKCCLKEAIDYAFKNKLCLSIQPEFQDEILIVDYSV